MMLTSAAARRYVAEGARRGDFASTTVRSYRSILTLFTHATGDPPVTRLTRRHIGRWYGSLSCGPATTRMRLCTVSTFLDWCVLNGHLRTNPATGFRPPKQPKHLPRRLSTDDVAAVLIEAPDARGRLMVLLMVQSGLRCAEVAGLQLGDVDLDQRLMMVRGKGDKERVVPIPDELACAVSEYLTEHPAVAGPLVRSYAHPHRGLTPGYVGDRMRRWMLAAGVKDRPYDGKSAHALRHTCLTDVLESGANIRQVQALAGHSSLQTTQRYLGWSVDDLAVVVEGRRYVP